MPSGRICPRQWTGLYPAHGAGTTNIYLLLKNDRPRQYCRLYVIIGIIKLQSSPKHLLNLKQHYGGPIPRYWYKSGLNRYFCRKLKTYPHLEFKKKKKSSKLWPWQRAKGRPLGGALHVILWENQKLITRELCR